MKHRRTGGLLLAAALTLGACAPTDSGGGDATSPPAREATEASDAPTVAPQSEAPAPTQYEQDEY